MGRHAFADVPRQARFLTETHPEIRNEALFGVVEGWDLALALWRAEGGFDALYPANAHPTLSFAVGGATMTRLDGRFRGASGGNERDSFILYPGGFERRYGARAAVRICQLYLPPGLIAAVAADAEIRGGAAAGLSLREDRIFARDRELREMTDQYLRRALDGQTSPSLLEMDTRALLIALRLIQSHSNLDAPPPAERGALSADRLRRVTDFMEAHIAEPLPLGALAAVAGLSRYHFVTAFRRATGMPPHRFLTMRRVARAKALIRSGHPLAELALDCGFASQQHLTSVFRKATGVAPSVWRAAHPPGPSLAERTGEAD